MRPLPCKGTPRRTFHRAWIADASASTCLDRGSPLGTKITLGLGHAEGTATGSLGIAKIGARTWCDGLDQRGPGVTWRIRSRPTVMARGWHDQRADDPRTPPRQTRGDHPAERRALLRTDGMVHPPLHQTLTRTRSRALAQARGQVTTPGSRHEQQLEHQPPARRWTGCRSTRWVTRRQHAYLGHAPRSSVTGKHSASRSTTSRQARCACRGW